MKKLLNFLVLFSFLSTFSLFALRIDEIKKKVQKYSFFINGSKAKNLKSKIKAFLPKEADALIEVLDTIYPNSESRVNLDDIIKYIDTHQEAMIETANVLESQASQTEKIEESVFSFFASLLSALWDFFHPTSPLGVLLLSIFLGLFIIGLGLLISFLI